MLRCSPSGKMFLAPRACAVTSRREQRTGPHWAEQAAIEPLGRSSRLCRPRAIRISDEGVAGVLELPAHEWRASVAGVIDILCPVALALIAILYSAVGQAGGTGYVALMGLAGFAPAIIKRTALALHVLVSAIGCVRFYRLSMLTLAKRLPVRRSWPAVLLARRRASSSAISLPTDGRRIDAGRGGADGTLGPGNQAA